MFGLYYTKYIIQIILILLYKNFNKKMDTTEVLFENELIFKLIDMNCRDTINAGIATFQKSYFGSNG